MTLKDPRRLKLIVDSPYFDKKRMIPQPSHPQTPLNGVDEAGEQQVSDAIDLLRTLRDSRPSTQTEIDARLDAARLIIATLNASSFMSQTERYDDQISVITELQSIAYHEVDGGGVQDIAQWCIRMYLQVVSQSRNDCAAALAGTICNSLASSLY